MKAEHHDCKSWLNFSRSVASITWAEHCNNYPSSSHTGRLTSPLRLHPDPAPSPLGSRVSDGMGWWSCSSTWRTLCELKWGRDCVRELDLLVSASVNWVCGSLDQAGLLIKLVCLIARGLGGLIVFWSLLRSCVFCGIYKIGRNLPLYPCFCTNHQLNVNTVLQLCWEWLTWHVQYSSRAFVHTHRPIYSCVA